MNTDRTCGCKSFRTCKICEEELGIKPREDWGKQLKDENREFYEYNGKTGSSFALDDPEKSFEFPGIRIIHDFVSLEEENSLVASLDELPWDLSQSGRRKQNFGPRANFKKRKAKNGAFKGFPACTKFIQERFKTVPMLESYRTVEQCSIEYKPETGAAIEPHIDDCWIWGERIVQLNLLSPTYLTCTPHTGGRDKYNLADVETYPKIISCDNQVIYNPFNEKHSTSVFEFSASKFPENCVVKIPLPARSLLVMYGSARYEWEHSILREDITDRRVVIAYREFTPPYLPGGDDYKVGMEVLENAELFW